jgi:hypothetical protein
MRRGGPCKSIRFEQKRGGRIDFTQHPGRPDCPGHVGEGVFRRSEQTPDLTPLVGLRRHLRCDEGVRGVQHIRNDLLARSNAIRLLGFGVVKQDSGV